MISSVERLFRKGFLRVVIATGTLSLGINMPCVTTVFVTDSVFLTPLNYRQASGRAGRRGFDLMGNVIFHKIPLRRTYQLMNSRLPSLTGHFPTSTTLILRLFILLYGSGNSDHAVASVNGLLSLNRISVNSEHMSFKHQVMHHVRFSIEYLRRTKLINESGAPINFANCVSNLYYTEPANFMLNALLRAGIFHDICDRLSAPTLTAPESDVVVDSINKELLLILAHFFGRRAFSKATNINELLESRSSSTVVLADLPHEVVKVIQEHNQLTLEIFMTYVKTFAKQHCATIPDNSMPFTGASFSPSSTSSSIDLDDSKSANSVRSAFVALSGHSDDFASLEDLISSVRGDIFLEESGIPYIPLHGRTKLNAYLYDFFLHGSIIELERANQIRRAEVWFVLNDFSMVLATITTCLKNLLIYGPDEDIKQAGIDDHNSGGAGDLLETKRDVMAGGEEVGTKSSYPGPSTDANESDYGFTDDEEDAEYLNDAGDGSALKERERLLKVLKGFVGLQNAFNEKFRAMFATKSDRFKGKERTDKRRPKLRV